MFNQTLFSTLGKIPKMVHNLSLLRPQRSKTCTTNNYAEQLKKPPEIFIEGYIGNKTALELLIASYEPGFHNGKNTIRLSTLIYYRLYL